MRAPGAAQAEHWERSPSRPSVLFIWASPSCLPGMVGRGWGKGKQRQTGGGEKRGKGLKG